MEFQEADFRRFLAKVEERDVDLLLMEELSFVAWFASLAGLGAEVGFLGAWHSVSDQDGETDLLLRVKEGSDRVGILIENKGGGAAHVEPGRSILPQRPALRGRGLV